ncbi:transmembrane protein C1orf162 homolog [Microcaecilia unicolor]|uniref:Transmembrane protein C1orf162 homolog n=1 Tax=Microcaecilia unicolor TaxID=1415580 RepID=A0A6P7ZVB6_9AMPH|nr:transmembrane protein C1orf162 homolog [Microcaecilia unicolor]
MGSTNSQTSSTQCICQDYATGTSTHGLADAPTPVISPSQSSPICSLEYLHVVLAFFSGVLLTLLLLTVVLYVRRLRCRRKKQMYQQGSQSTDGDHSKGSRNPPRFPSTQTADSKDSGLQEGDMSYATLSFRQVASSGGCLNDPELNVCRPEAPTVYSSVLINP